MVFSNILLVTLIVTLILKNSETVEAEKYTAKDITPHYIPYIRNPNLNKDLRRGWTKYNPSKRPHKSKAHNANTVSRRLQDVSGTTVKYFELNQADDNQRNVDIFINEGQYQYDKYNLSGNKTNADDNKVYRTDLVSEEDKDTYEELPYRQNNVSKTALRSWRNVAKDAAKLCDKACKCAIKNMCKEYQCNKRFRKDFRKECKKECNSKFLEGDDKDSSSYDDDCQ